MSAPAISARGLSKWYGNVLGLSDVTLSVEPGITGLLGPNGAGKSTLMKLMTGQLKPSLGEVRIRGRRAWNDDRLYAAVGFCPEPDAFYEEVTGRELLCGLLALRGFARAEAAERTERALALVDLTADGDRLIRGYSRGMRQRIKFAQAVAHDPDVIILDEPLSALDPLGKRKLIRVIREFGAEGRTVLVSSHVLPEIEALTTRILLMHQGKILAEGDLHYIRDLIDTHPHVIAVKCDDPRRLAAAFVGDPDVLRLSFGPDGRTLTIETHKRDRFFGRLPAAVLEAALAVDEITSPDDNLQAVFDYLVGK